MASSRSPRPSPRTTTASRRSPSATAWRSPSAASAVRSSVPPKRSPSRLPPGGECSSRPRQRCFPARLPEAASCGAGACSARVELVDLALVLVGDDRALDLHRRRQLAVFLGQVAGEDGDLLDLLDPGELLVDLGQVRLDRHADIAVAGELPRVLGQAVLLGVGNRLFRVERDQPDQVGAAVADDDALRDQRVLLDLVLEVGRGDVLAAGGDDDVLLAPGDRDEAVGVDRAEVAGVQPAVDDRLAGGLVVLVVALEHVGALDEDLVVRGDLYFAAGEGLADRADLEVVRGGAVSYTHLR